MLGETLVFSDYLNLFLFDAKNQIGAVVKAMQAKGVFQSLAEPNLIALNGKEASFLAGGEFPYPVPQGKFGAFTIHFKEYGVRLSFTPTVLGGDLINLKIKPEVSSLDFNNAVVIEGFRIPALTSRRAETEVELHDGQTFAIAGLLNNTALSSMRKVPGLGDIPVLGTLFKSRAYQKDQTELVVMVTPTSSAGIRPACRRACRRWSSRISARPTRRCRPGAYVGSPRHPAKRPAPTAAPAPAPAANQPQPSAPVSGSSSPRRARTLPRRSRSPARRRARPSTRSRSAAARDSGERRAAVGADHQRDAGAAGSAGDAAAATKEQLKAIEQAARKSARRPRSGRRGSAQRRAMDAAAKQRPNRSARTRSAARQAAKLELERQKRESDVAKKNAEEERRKNEEEQKRQKALTDAALKLKQAQDAYQAEVAKTSTNKGGTK